MLVILALFTLAMIDASNYYGSRALVGRSWVCAIAIILANLALNVRLHLKVRR